MAFDGYFQLGGKELVNAARTAAYVANSQCAIPLRDLGCEGLGESLEETYTTPAGDDAPWYDANYPETGEFLGVYPLEVTGLEDSTMEAEVTQSVQDGAVIGEARFASRSMRIKLMLIAESELGMSAGMAWLRAALAPSPCTEHGGSCGGAVLCYFAACPDPDQDIERYQRFLHDVGCVQGARVLNEQDADGTYIREVSFVLEAGIPHPVAETQVLVPLTPMSELTTTPWQAESCVSSSFDPIVDPDCPPLPAPPRPPVIPASCVEGDMTPGNPFPNPSVETNLTNITSAVPGGAGTLTRFVDADFAYDGTAVARLQVTTPPASAGGVQISNVAFGIKPGARYDFRAQVRCDGAIQRVRIQVTFLSPTGGDLGLGTAGVSGVTEIDSNGWTEVVIDDMLAPDGAGRARIDVVADPLGRVWLTNESLYVDAWSNGPFYVQYERLWLNVDKTDTAVWSSMVPMVMLRSGPEAIRQVRVRVYPNPFNRSTANARRRYSVLKNGAMPLTSRYWGIGGSGTVATFSRQASGGPSDGEYSNVAYGRITIVGSPVAGAPSISYNGVGNAWGLGSDQIVPGEVYTIQAWVRCSVARQLTLSYAWADADGNTLSTSGSTTVSVNANTWTKVVIENRTAPANAGRVLVNATGSVTSWSAGQTLDMALPMVFESPVSEPYWDGSTPNARGWTYGWDGQSHLSPSWRQRQVVDACSYCSEFIVSYLPAETLLTVDALTENAFMEVIGTGNVQTVNGLMYGENGGPMSWPSLECGIPYIITVDVPDGTQPNVQFGLELTRREEA